MYKLKSASEIQIMREGGKILANILKKLAEAVKPGVATKDLEKLARELILSYKVKSSFLGYDGYPAVLCTSIDSEIVHAVPSERIIKEGDLVKLDMGILHRNFHTDSALTILVPGGEDTQLKEKLVRVTKRALRIAVSEIKIGRTLGDIGAVVQKYVESEGFNVVRELVGHGIGRELHEPPQIPNYGKPGQGEKLAAGMVLAIEPMVVAGDWRIKESEDGFGFETKDGSLAAHLEHTIAVLPRGPLTLTEK